MCRGQRTPSAMHCFSLFICFNFVLFSFGLLSLDRILTVLELATEARQTGQQTPGIYLLLSLYLPDPELQLFTTTHRVILNHDSGSSKTCPHHCKANSLLTEIFPKPAKFMIMCLLVCILQFRRSSPGPHVY